MIQESITFQDSLGTKLVGILSQPKGGSDMPIIILCHGFTSSKDRYRVNAIFVTYFLKQLGNQ